MCLCSCLYLYLCSCPCSCSHSFSWSLFLFWFLFLFVCTLAGVLIYVFFSSLHVCAYVFVLPVVSRWWLFLKLLCHLSVANARISETRVIFSPNQIKQPAPRNKPLSMALSSYVARSTQPRLTALAHSGVAGKQTLMLPRTQQEPAMHQVATIHSCALL